MTKVKIKLTSKISQEQDSETFVQEMTGELVKSGSTIRISYTEDKDIPVKMLLRNNELTIKRGGVHDDYSLMRFCPDEKKACRYLVSGRQMDLTSSTNLLNFEEKVDGSQQLLIEYNLFSGLYLIGDYAVTLIFT